VLKPFVPDELYKKVFFYTIAFKKDLKLVHWWWLSNYIMLR
jgi:hypothetical protein